ncbi:glycosyltransferase family 2 protein [Neobacillus sp. GCM10023253]|uniref:glycosyltransferase family 2 protein n=1 Tax=Neobacillus sp. GCM10023253 TaxID=3252644 RepID=UPI00361E1BE4
MTEHKPLVSIGLPVYNGEKYIAEAIESLLSQEYTNIEIIISDNASTDTTPQICQQYQQKDPRIHYFRNDTNIGAAKNFNRTFELSKGDFFMWQAFDDLRHPAYISKCLQKFNQHPEAIICVTEISIIDTEGKYLNDEHEAIETINLTFTERLHQFFLNVTWMGSVIYGLWRSEYLKQTRLFMEEYGPDVILCLELFLLGSAVKVKERLLFYRHFPEKTHYDQINSITSNPERQQTIASTSHTQLIKNLYLTLKEKNVPSELIQDFFDVLVFQQMSWVQMSCFEHTPFLKDRVIDSEFVYEFMNALMTTEKPPEQIVASIESSAVRFQKLAKERPIILIGSLQVSIILWWKYFSENHIPVHGFLEESALSTQPNFFEKLTDPSELPVRPFVIIASVQPNIHTQHLTKKGYENRKDFLYVASSAPFLYLI